MDLLQTLRALLRADDPGDGFRALVESLPRDSVRCVVWAGADREVRHAWPPGSTVTPELLATAVHLRRAETLPLRSDFPADHARFSGCEALVVPLRYRDEPRGACLLVAAEGFATDGTAAWEALGEALLLCEERHARLSGAEERNRLLQRRVEESEALHTLGLAANRTLHPSEVLRMVARFARSLLGADYVTVSTKEDDRIVTVASVGLNDADAGEDDYWLARRVVEAEKPVLVGGKGATAAVEEFPFHSAEGMRVGLGIPLSLFGESFGALVIGYREEREVSPRDLRFALTLAGHAAVAISNARLHARVQEHSDRLARAYEELHQLSQAKERFFASINHELRNPIGAVMGYLTLVTDGTAGEIPPAAQNFLAKAHRSAKTLLELVNDILDLSKIAAGKMEVDLRRCTLAEILDGTLTTIAPLAEQKGVALAVEPVDSIPELRTDPPRVQQILVNLLSNAVKFTGEGGVRLSAVLRKDPPGATGEPMAGAWVDVLVTDTGPGLSAENQALVFEEFEQVKGTKGGTGLGLPISRRLARLLGGDLLVESEPGAGATFILRLPASQDGAGADGARAGADA